MCVTMDRREITFDGATIQDNTYQIAIPYELEADAGIELGYAYDIVLDCNRNGYLGSPGFH